MELERIEVRSRDEFQGGERPLSFIWREKEFEIEEILDRWYEGYLDSTRMPMRYFRVRAKDGEIFLLRYHELFAAWSLIVPRSAESEYTLHS